MSIDLNEVTPQDHYVVVIKEPVYDKQISYLMELYQPIIGVEAASFYLTLLNHVSFGEIGCSSIGLHRQLMSQMYISFKSIIKSRKVLEAVGLLKTIKYTNKENEGFIYEYLLVPPLSPVQFFQSDILSVLLLNRVGKSQFQLIRKKAIPDFNWNNGLYINRENITKAFDEVFDTILESELRMTSELEHFPQISNTEGKGKALNIKDKYLDIDFIKGMVSDIFNLENSMNTELIEILNELAYLYRLTDIDIVNLLKDHTIYDKAGKIELKALKKRIRERYQFEQKEVLFHNKENFSPNSKKAEPPQTNKAQQHNWILENFSPIELMEQYQGGGRIPDADLAIIEGLMQEYKLPHGVVNVLIEYVMLTNDYKLPKNLTEKIAGHWKRLKIKTVEEALVVAKKEHQLYRGWQDTNPKSTIPKRSKSATNDKKAKVPDYIIQQEQKYHKNNETEVKKEINLEKKAKIEKLLKDLGEI